MLDSGTDIEDGAESRIAASHHDIAAGLEQVPWAIGPVVEACVVNRRRGTSSPVQTCV